MREIRILMLLSFAAALELAAQTNSGGISGTVFDESGAVVPNVELTIKQESTFVERITHTDVKGRYSVQQLPPGPYQITARHADFQTAVRKEIGVYVGQEAVANITLKVGAISSTIVVPGNADVVDTRTTALSGVMSNRFIRALPLNGRDLNQLALLGPGVVMARRSSDSGGAGTKLVANGSRPSQNSFVLDGSDINDATNATPGSAAGGLLGVDTLQEFRVLTNSYSAAYGRSAGGVVSAITKSGSNQLHGSVFEFIRNSALGAKNYFDSATAPIPGFKRNQFGAEADGPISRDKTFFMASYEGLRQSLGVTSTAVVPDADAREGQLPGQAPMRVNPAVIPYLNLVPLPNGAGFSDGTARYTNVASQKTAENFAAARIDHHFSPKTSVFARYAYDGAISSIPDNLDLSTANSASRNQYLTAEATHIFSERLLNTARFSFNKSLSQSFPSYRRAIDPSLSFLPGVPARSL